MPPTLTKKVRKIFKTEFCEKLKHIIADQVCEHVYFYNCNWSHSLTSLVLHLLLIVIFQNVSTKQSKINKFSFKTTKISRSRKK